MNPTRTTKALLVLASMAILPLCSSGCGVDSSTHPAKDPVSPPAEPASAVVYPDSWDSISVARQYDNEKAWGNGHWSIDRTDCGEPQYQPFSVTTWNALANAMNAALKLKPLPDTGLACSDLPDGYSFYDGSVTAQMSDGSNRTLFKVANYQVCTSVPEAIAAAEAFRWLNDLVVMANAYGCPHPTTVPPAPGM